MTTAEKIVDISKTFGINSVLASRVLSEVDSLDETSIQLFLNNKPKPFVKWVGGKRQLLNQFRELGLYPPKAFDPRANTYFEPFVGGGAMFFDLLPLKASINDINTELVITYATMRNNNDKLISELNSGDYLYVQDIFLFIRGF